MIPRLDVSACWQLIKSSKQLKPMAHPGDLFHLISDSFLQTIKPSMKTQTLKIQIPEGYEIDDFDKCSGEIKFKEKPKLLSVIDRIRTDGDVFRENSISWATFERQCEGLNQDEKAYRFLRMLCRSLNQGVVPNLSSPECDKFYPIFTGDSCQFWYSSVDKWNRITSLGDNICFKTEELAEHAGKNFTKWYKQMITYKL